MYLKNLSSSFLKKYRFISPQKIIDDVGIKEGDTVIDFGAGIGFWTLPLSRAVGRKGKVYALTANSDFLSLLKKKLELKKISNVDALPFDLEKEDIPTDEKSDFLIMANVLHVLRDKENAFKRAKSMIKKDGRLIIVDYLKLNTSFGPPMAYRLSEEDIILMAEKSGFKFKCILDAGFHHYGLVFIK